MHKSTLIFGLLMSSLVMLVIMPFLNQNNSLFNVMAQEYDKYGDSHYSQYPTELNKYECQKGPFEGFFVSSVEFCKRVTSIVNGENGIGPQGPPGPASTVPGPEGPPGPASTVPGPAGPNQIPSSKILQFGSTFGPGLVGPFTTSVSCPSGDTILSGGYQTPNPNDWSKIHIASDYPVGTSIWKVEGFATAALIGQFSAYAHCFDN